MNKSSSSLFVLLLLSLFVGIAMMAAPGNQDATNTAIPATPQNAEEEVVVKEQKKNDQGGENVADTLVEENQYDTKRDSLFGNVYDMFRKLATYQSFYYGQYVDPVTLEKRLANIKEDLNNVDNQYQELKNREGELLRFKKENEAQETGRNYVVEQLVNSELERLDSLEWRLSRIKKRLLQAKLLTESKIDDSK